MEKHTDTRMYANTHKHKCALWILHLFWVIDWTGQKILGEAWLLKHLISQLSKCGKKNTTGDSDLCPFIALGLLRQVAAGHFWGVRQSSPQSSCSCWPPWLGPLGLGAVFLLTGTLKPAAFCHLLVPTWPWPVHKAKQWRYQQQRQCISREWFSDATDIKGWFYLDIVECYIFLVNKWPGFEPVCQ